MENLILDLETYLNNEVHGRCEYDIYSALMDFNAEINAEYEATIKIIEEMKKENAKAKKEIEYWKLSFNKQVETSRK